MRTIVIGCRGKNGCRSSLLKPFLMILEYPPRLFLRLRIREPAPNIHHRRCSSLRHRLRGRPPSSGEKGSLSVSDVHVDEGAEEKKWGRGDTERDGTGVDVAVDDTEERPEDPSGGNRKFGLDEDEDAGNGIRGRG